MRPPFVTFCLALLLAGCAGTSPTVSSTQESTTPGASSEGATSTSASPTPSSPSASQSPAAPRTHTVNITGNQFVGGTLAIHKGDTVRWVHKDGTTPHSVKADDGSFDSNGGLPCPGPGCLLQATNPSFDRTFPAAGSFPYHCEVHGGMKGTITVA